MERALRIGTRQDTRAVELVDIGRKRIAALHVGNRIVRDLIDRFVGAFRAVEDVDKLCSGDRSVHMRRSIACIILFDNAVCNCVRNIAVIPGLAAVSQADFTGAVELVQRRCQLDGLRHGQRRVRLELVGRHAVDQVVLPRCLDAGIVPAMGRNIEERELAQVGTGVRVERVLRGFARGNDRDRCGRQLRNGMAFCDLGTAAKAVGVARVTFLGVGCVFRVADFRAAHVVGRVVVRFYGAMIGNDRCRFRVLEPVGAARAGVIRLLALADAGRSLSRNLRCGVVNVAGRGRDDIAAVRALHRLCFCRLCAVGCMLLQRTRCRRQRSQRIRSFLTRGVRILAKRLRRSKRVLHCL